jgi:serine protease Do
MKYIKYIFFGILTLFSIVTCHAGKPTASIAETNPSLAPMLKKTIPAVVNIAVRGEIPAANLRPFDKRQQQDNPRFSPRFEELGSGVIIDAEHGYIVTNAHVIKDAQAITVTLNDSRSMRAKVIGYDTPSDIAVIQINAKRLEKATFGDSDKLNVGDFVCAIGSPFGLQQTVTSGVVSGLERSELGIGGFESFIQTDASINPGSSGGALVNMKGELVGINTAIIAPVPINVGIGLAIPSNMTKSIVNQLIKHGKVSRGVMGVMVQNITPALAEAMKLKNPKVGALVSQVLEESPAATAGLQSKDIIVKIMGKPVHSATQIRNIASLLNIGSKVDLQVQRGNKLINFHPIITSPEDLKKPSQKTQVALLSGLGLRNFNVLVDNQQIKGVEVLYVDDTSVAYSCGLHPGDIILTAASQPVTTISELQTIAGKSSKQLLLEVKRGPNGNIFLVLEE